MGTTARWVQSSIKRSLDDKILFKVFSKELLFGKLKQGGEVKEIPKMIKV